MRIRKKTAPIAAAALVAAAVTGSAGPAAAGGSCTPAWATVATPPQPNSDAKVASVDPLGPDDTWFAGWRELPGIHGWNLHWNGTSVSTATQPPQPPGPFGDGIFPFAEIESISLDSDTDGWGVGGPWVGGNTGVMRWHDGRWIPTPAAVSPQPATVAISLYGIASISPDDAWAVGTEVGNPGGAAIEHWDGTQWSLVPNPDSSRHGAELQALTVVSAGDIWAVGRQNDSGGQPAPFAMHWDGTAWSDVSVPGGTGVSELTAVSATGPGDIWVAGAQTKPGSDLAIPLVEHWNGATWTVQQLPDIGSSELTGIYAASANDVWATAEQWNNAVLSPGNPVPGTTSYFLHWNGTVWTSVPVPGPSEFNLIYEYGAIGGTGPDDVWATGFVQSLFDSADVIPQIAHLSCGQGADA